MELVTAFIGFIGVILSALIAARRPSKPVPPNVYSANPGLVTGPYPGAVFPPGMVGQPMPGQPMPGSPMGQPMPGSPIVANPYPGGPRPGPIPGQPLPYAGQPFPGGFGVMAPPKPTKISISVWLGLATLIAWFVPLIGLPLSLISIGKGLNDLFNRTHTLVRTGIYISLIGLMASVANSAIGFYMGYRGDF